MSFQDAQADAPACAYGQIMCDGRKRVTCDGKGGILEQYECEVQCADGRGCVPCMPDVSVCANGLAKICQAAGSSVREVTFACDGPGMTCTPGGCEGPCSPAKLDRTHAGCDFWPTITANEVSNTQKFFHFGLLLGNPSATVAAKVWIVGPDGQPYKTYPLSLAPSEVQSVALDYLTSLKGAEWESSSSEPTRYVPKPPTESVNQLKGSHHVQSDQPIVAYQFNTLEAQSTVTTGGFTCADQSNAGSGPCYSRSMDASLLLPTHVLSASGGDGAAEDLDGGDSDAQDDDGGANPTDPFYYVVGGYHGWQVSSPSDGGPASVGDFLAITAVEDDTRLRIGLSKTARVLPWAEPKRFVENQPTNLTMGSSQVIELYTEGPGSSFSGTTIQSNHPLHLLSGHPCVAIPNEATTCGHMEDVVLPYYALGTEYVLVPAGDPNYPTPYSVRIQTTQATGDTLVTFNPADLQAAITLSAGGSIELSGNKIKPMVVRSEKGPIVVTQFVSSRGGGSSPVDASSDSDPYRVGGPNQLTVVPTSQYLKRVTFASAPGFKNTYAQIVAPTGAIVKLDGDSLDANKFSAIGSSGFSYTVRPLTTATTVHVVESDKPVGVVVQGVGAYTSYLYAGGMGLSSTSP